MNQALFNTLYRIAQDKALNPDHSLVSKGYMPKWLRYDVVESLTDEKHQEQAKDFFNELELAFSLYPRRFKEPLLDILKNRKDNTVCVSDILEVIKILEHNRLAQNEHLLISFATTEAALNKLGLSYKRPTIQESTKQLTFSFAPLTVKSIRKHWKRIVSAVLERDEKRTLKEMSVLGLNTREKVESFLQSQVQANPKSYVLKKLLVQARLWQSFENIDKLKHLPFDKAWCLSLDPRFYKKGSYALEEDLYFIFGAMRGLLYVTTHLNEPISLDFLINAHNAALEGVHKTLPVFHSRNQHNRYLNPLSYKPQNTGLRDENAPSVFLKFPRRKTVESETMRWIQRDKKWFEYRDRSHKIVFTKVTEQQLREKFNKLYSEHQEKIKELTTHYNQAVEHLRSTSSDAKFTADKPNLKESFNRLKIIQHLTFCQRLSLTHFFMDGNVRASNLMLYRLLIEDPDLPMSILHNPNNLQTDNPKGKLLKEFDKGIKIFQNLTPNRRVIKL